ncbi:glycosyltransferase [Candidatus Poseidoniaceae archaeon]|nr:glycosyltransferase [Candidatus Poseidoniaceae archaeon]
MGQELSSKFQIGVIVATCDRPDLLSKRSIPSIMGQSQPPDFLIVVDDSRLEENIKLNEHYISSLDTGNTVIAIIRNHRTLGACGSWNTGIDWIFEVTAHPESTYIAILDDDDEWLPLYLETCISTCKTGNFDMVAAGIQRLETKHSKAVIYPSPTAINANEFLVGNGGIQGSNIFVRMRTMLMAGCFDESLRSSTDRDLCIRIADLGTVTYTPITSNLVKHYAELDRIRLTTKGSEAKLSGLTVFWQKYYGRMENHQRTQFKKRAKELFSWHPPTEKPSPFQVNSKTALRSYVSEWLAPAPPSRPPFTLNIGVITSEPDTIWPLLQSISIHKIRVRVFILDNGCPPIELAAMKEKITKINLDVNIFSQHQQQVDARRGLFGQPYKQRPVGQVGIAQARTMIQRYLGRELARDIDSIGWVMDDDMRIDKRAKSFIAWLPILREEGVDVVLGAYEGSSPNPPLNGLRVQLVDLVHNLNWLNKLGPEELLPDRSIENRLARINCPDYYYDLSRKHTSHLESPHWIEKVDEHETVAKARNRLLEGANSLIFGRPLTRPLVATTPLNPLNEIKDSVNRGGITFILNHKTLTQTPNSIFHIGGQEARRSDMMWAIVNRYFRSFVIKAVGFPVNHIARNSSIVELNIPKAKAEIVGSAMYAGLVTFLAKNPSHTLDFSEKDISEIQDIFERNLSDRMIRLEMSFYRIRGLHLTLKQNFDEPLIQPVMNQLENLFSDEMWSELNEEVMGHRAIETIQFLTTIRDVAEDYAISDSKSEF